MDAGLGTMIFMGLILKIPIVAACWLVWWAMRAQPEPAEAPEEEGGQRRRYRRQPKRPSGPRRGPHAPDAAPIPCPDEDGILVTRRPLGRPLTARHIDAQRR